MVAASMWTATEAGSKTQMVPGMTMSIVSGWYRQVDGSRYLVVAVINEMTALSILVMYFLITESRCSF